MELSALIHQMVVLLLVMTVGYIANKMGIMDNTANRKISNLLLNVTIPAMILSSSIAGGGQLSGAELFQILVLAFLCYAIFIALAFLVPAALRTPKPLRGVYGFMLIFSNSFFLGIPIVNAMFGPEAVFYVSLTNIPYSLLLYTLGVSLVIRADKKKEGLDWKLLFNPGAVAAVLGVVLYVSGLPIPPILADTLSLTGSVTTPAAMLVIGSTLAGISIKGILNDPRLYALSAVRLILIPVIIKYVMALFVSDPMILGTLVVLAATPVGSNTVIICLEYSGQIEADTASRGVFLSTALSMVTIPLMMWLLF